jgi:putative peptidoglycan lipid II flippase
MAGFALQDILNKAFYALHDAATPMKIGISGLVINVLLSLGLSRLMGIGGLGLAASISSVVMASLLVIFIKRKIPAAFGGNMLPDLLKILVSAVIMGILVILVYNMINGLIYIIIPCAAGAAMYFLLSYLLKVEEAGIALGMLRGFLKR